MIYKKPVLIFGNNATARLVAWMIERDGGHVAAFTVNEQYIQGETFYNKPLIPFETIETLYSPSEYIFYAALGATRMNDLRLEIMQKATLKGYSLESVISLKAQVQEAFIPPRHCRIGDGAIIQPFTQIGDNTVIAGNAFIGHDTIVGNNSFIAAGTVIGGNVKIGNNCFIGTGAVVRSKIVLGDRTVVGAGVTLLESSEAGSVYMNTGAQKMPFNSDSIQF